MSYDAAIFGAAPAKGWCEACAVSPHPGVLLMNGDEVQGCDECNVVTCDEHAAACLRQAGCVVELLDDDGNPTAGGDSATRAAYVLVGGGPFYCLHECHGLPCPMPCDECGTGCAS